MSGWKDDPNAYTSKCVGCGSAYVPMLRLAVIIKREAEPKPGDKV